MSTTLQKLAPGNLTPGIYEMSAELYHADPAPTASLSASIAKVICQTSMLHAKMQHPRLTELAGRDEAVHFDIGTAAHALLLQGLEVAHIIQATRKEGSGKQRVDTGEPVTDYKTKDAREERDSARAAGLVPILAHQWKAIQEMVAAAREQLAAHKEASDMFTAGKPEQSLIWFEPDEQIWCRARFDWLHDTVGFLRYIDDYKTVSTSANPENLSRTIFSLGYDIQEAFYRRGLKAIDPHCEPVFRFAFQETYPPYALSVVSLGPDVMAIGEKKIAYAREKFSKSLKSGIWPAYPTRICYPVLPKWEEERWLEREVQS